MLKKTVLFLICALPISLMAQETKLGHVNFQEIFAAMPEQATIQKSLDDQTKVIDSGFLQCQLLGVFVNELSNCLHCCVFKSATIC